MRQTRSLLPLLMVLLLGWAIPAQATFIKNTVTNSANLTDGQLLVGDLGAHGIKTFAACTDGLVVTWSSGALVCGSVLPDTHTLLSATHTDTVSATPNLGDMIVSNGSNLWTVLAGNTAASAKCLTQTGTGSASALPTWAACGSGGAPTTATYITQTSDGTLSAEQALSSLASGCLSVTTGTGVLASSGSACGIGGGTDHVMMAFSSGTTAISYPNTTAETMNVGVGVAVETAVRAANAVEITIPASMTLVSVRYDVYVAGGLASASTAYVHKICKTEGATCTTGVNMDYSATNAVAASETGLTFALSAGDRLCLQISAPSIVGGATSVYEKATLYFTVP